MLGTNTDSGLTSLSWLAGCTLTVGALDADEQGTRCRRRFKRPSTHNRSSPYGATSNLPQYWATGGSKADFTEGGEELETSRPAFSFTCLIGLAILANRSATVSVGKIYAYIQCNFPYFREAKSTWRNSVRHVLSLNKFFYKANTQAQASRKQESARLKGGLWGVKPCMLRALLGLLRRPAAPSPPPPSSTSTSTACGHGAPRSSSGSRRRQRTSSSSSSSSSSSKRWRRLPCRRPWSWTWTP